MALGFWSACYTAQPSRTVLRPLARRASNNAIARKSYDAAVQSAQRTMTRMPWLQKVRGLADSFTCDGIPQRRVHALYTVMMLNCNCRCMRTAWRPRAAYSITGGKYLPQGQHQTSDVSIQGKSIFS